MSASLPHTSSSLKIYLMILQDVIQSSSEDLELKDEEPFEYKKLCNCYPSDCLFKASFLLKGRIGDRAGVVSDC